MKMYLAVFLLTIVNLLLPFHSAQAQGTTFTYQGRLVVAGTGANGLYDFNFQLFNAASNGSPVATSVTVPAVAVTNGLFTVSIAFGPDAFDGSSRWLDIGVVTNGGGAFTSLTPRQAITAAPYAILAGNVTGVIPAAQLPSSVVTNGASGLNLSGSFSGNGAGVTNLDLTLSSGNSIRSQSGDFVLSATLTVGNSPATLASADVNGDGRPDVICGNYSGNTVSILTNNGNGGLVLASSIAVSSPNSITAADVNGDNKMDLIVANFGGNTLTVLTNNGAGGFALSLSPTVGAGPYSVCSADVNGDNKIDLICANASANTVSVLTNNGSGGFVLSATLPVGSAPHAVIAADINGDHKVDLICGNFSANTVSVLTNNGSGGFASSSTLSVGASPQSLVAADVNGDGKMDLVCANYNGSTLSVLTNNGSGGFALSSSPAVGGGPYSVTAADVNADGRMDLICANWSSYTLSVLINKGGGSFALGSTLSVGVKPEAVVAVDLNGDGKVDLISANSFDNTLSVYFNNTEFDGVFVGAGQFSTASFGASLGAKINLYGTLFGIGIQNSVLYSRVASGGGFGWFAGGVHSDTTFDAGLGGSVLMTLTSGGLAVNGTFVSASDRNLKQDFSEVNSRAVLEKVAQLPIQSWAYKNDPKTRHVGPMAQDFYNAFTVGPDDKHIATVDADGVALAAIQGLNQKLTEKDAQITALEKRLHDLEQLVRTIERK